ncbi:acyl transferase/acyl hydrolase/lysophospholipase [Chlamydoabsidia padenii]|nr:acyl transferase/acyl hydrolase/lysophospholipase [Chlamydoabsidia padenii]
MSALVRKWPLLSILASTCLVYSGVQHSTLDRKQIKSTQHKTKPTIIRLPLPTTTNYQRPLFSSLVLPITALECNDDDSNINIDQDDSIIEKAKANFMELQDQFTRTILSKVSLVENLQVLSATELRDALTNLWDTMTLTDIIDSVKDVKDTVANPELNKDAVVRFGSNMAQEEQVFLHKRLEHQRAAFASFIGVDILDVEIEDIPIIGIASSGGGYRAMLGLTGYMKAMKESGALDCVAYIAGISGSTWAMSLYYSVLTNCDPDTMVQHLKSHVGTHIASVSHVLSMAADSTQNAKLLLQGIGQRYLQQSTVNLVDLFGTLIGATLYTRTVLESKTNDGDEGDEKEELLLDKKDMKLSSQRRFFEDGSQPLPIYCVVRQDLNDNMEAKPEASQNQDKDKECVPGESVGHHNENTDDEDDTHTYQWFEFTAYEFGSEELDAWIPMWAFGRKFIDGKNMERLPEQRLDSLLGMFGSAFSASTIHFYQEIRSFLPASALRMADETIGRYQKSLSVYHPISPAVYPNPFYTHDRYKSSQDQHLDLDNSEHIHLMDAGMDNNIPFFPLIGQRKADIVLAVDLSADIQTAPHFDRAEGYVKRHGIDGWPVGAGWPKENINETIRQIGNEPTKDIEIIADLQQQQQDEYLIQRDKQQEGQQDDEIGSGATSPDNHTTDGSDSSQKHGNRYRYALGPCTVFPSTATTSFDTDEGNRLITLIYFPFIGNDNYDPDFDPQTADYCSTWNFVYQPEQVEKVVGLAQANWNENTDQVRSVFRAVWERKRRLRLQQRDSENSGNLFLYP